MLSTEKILLCLQYILVTSKGIGELYTDLLNCPQHLTLQIQTKII